MPLIKYRVLTTRPFGKRCAAALFSAALAASLFPGVAFADVRSSDIIAGLSVQDRGLAASSCPNIVAEHSIVVDENGTVYFERDADSQVQIASVTKTMTAIVALEYGDLQNTTITVSQNAASIGESSAMLQAGDSMNLESALKAMMICSGNDAATAIAECMGDSVRDTLKEKGDPNVPDGAYDAFVYAMNKKAKALGMEHPSGALVASVLDDEPAAKAGIEAGDVITKVNGKSVEDASALLRAIAAHKPSTSVTLDVWRNGKAVTMDVTLGDRQTGVNSGKPSEAGQKQQNQGQLGLTVRPIKDEERRELKLEGKGGLLVLDVDPSKPAAEAGVRPGDVIVKANRQAVSSPEDLSKIVAGEGSKRGAVMLQINRRGENIFRAVPVSSGK